MTPEPDLAELGRVIAARQGEAIWIEMRAIHPVNRGAACRWFGPDMDAGEAVAWAAGQQRRGCGIYSTRNRIPVKPTKTELRKSDSATALDVTEWLYLYLDIEVERPAGTAATEAERAAAAAVADELVGDRLAAGWGPPAEVDDSGNGVHVWYRLSPGVTDSLVEAATAALAARHNHGGVKVDTSVTDRNRISRLPGSVNTKGDGRRRCRVVAADPGAKPVTLADLAELAVGGAAATAPPPNRPSWSAAPVGEGVGDRPGDDFNARADWWEHVLLPAGAKSAGKRADGVELVTRPNKAGGTSATLGYGKARDGTPGLFPFTSAWPELEHRKLVNKFCAFARLHHRGDFAAATRAVLKMGFGKSHPKGHTTHRNGKPMSDGATAAGVGSPNGRGAGSWADGQPAGGGQPRVVVPPYQDFPTEHLPDGMRPFVRDQALALNCDPVFVAVHALALAGASVGNSTLIRLKGGFEQPPLIWACMVADSGTGKSPGLAPCLSIATSLNKYLIAKYLKELADFKRDMEAWENAEEADRGERPKPPVEQTFCIEDITTEEMVVTAADSKHGLLMAHDEMTNLFAMFTRYKGKQGGTDAGKYLKAYDAGWTDYRRRTGDRRRVTCERTFLGITGGIQPQILKAHMADGGKTHIHSGMAARFLFVMPPKRCLRWTDREPSREMRKRFREIVFALADLPFGEDGVPVGVPITAAAKSIYAAHYDSNSELAENHDGGPMAAALPKASGQAARLALIHHVVTEVAGGRDPHATPVGEASMAAGIALANWFVKEAERVYAMFRESEEDADTRSLFGLIHHLIARKRTAEVKDGEPPTADSVTVRELVRCKRFKKSILAEAALDEQANAKRGHWEDRCGGNGRKVRHFVPVPLDTSPDDGSDDDESEDSGGQEGTGADA